jgi:hypothetical protein
VIYGFQNFTDIRVNVVPPEQTNDSLEQSRGFAIAFDTSKFDLTLFVSDLGKNLLLDLEYDSGLFLPGTIRNFLSILERFAHVLTEHERIHHENLRV